MESLRVGMLDFVGGGELSSATRRGAAVSDFATSDISGS